MINKYQQGTRQRREAQTKTGKFRGGKLVPIMAVPYLQSESGTLRQDVTFELDPIAGRLVTPVTAHVVSVFVPIQAMEVLQNPEEQFAGNDEIIRSKLLSGAALFGMEPETDLTKHMGIQPISIDGTKSVCSAARIAHNAAVNFLRRRMYVKASQIDAANESITPALLGSTALDWYRGVLDPEDRVNGEVKFEFDAVQVPVRGIGLEASADQSEVYTFTDAAGETQTKRGYKIGNGHSSTTLFVDQRNGLGADSEVPEIYADISDATASGLSLKDFYQAERADAIARTMRQIVNDNPEYGEQMVNNFVHGLNITIGKQPMVIYEKDVMYGATERMAQNGPDLDVSQTDMTTRVSFSTIVPRTEFGGIVITFAALKPDETIPRQPHPILAAPWGSMNFAADELAIDPVPVYAKQLDHDVPEADEDNVVMYIANNGLLQNYSNYGLSRHQDETAVENKTSLWQHELPVSLDPDLVIYPESLEHYPFQDQEADVVTYTIASATTITTPVIFGPSPIEELDVIDNFDLFEDQGVAIADPAVIDT